MTKINFKQLGLILCLAIISVLVFTTITHAGDSLYNTLNSTGYKNTWKAVLSFLDYFVVIFLIVISFANILNLKVEAYAIKSILPMLILGVIFANLSWFICMMFIDLAEVLMSWITYSATQGSTVSEGNLMMRLFFNTLFSSISADNKSLGDKIVGMIFTGNMLGISGIFGAVLSIIVLAILLLSFIALGILMWFRGYFLIFLVFVSPLAFIGMAIPLTQKFFQQWLSNFLKWVFVGPIAWFLMWMALIIQNQIYAGSGSHAFQAILLALAATVAAVITPFMLGGAVGNALLNTGKKIGAWAGKTAFQRTGVPQRFSAFTKRYEEVQKIKDLPFEAQGAAAAEAAHTAGEAFWSGRGVNALKIGVNQYGEGMTREKEINETFGRVQSLQKKARTNFNDLDTDKVKDYHDSVSQQLSSTKPINKENLDTGMLALAKNGSLTNEIAAQYRQKNPTGESFLKHLLSINSQNQAKAIQQGMLPTGAVDTSLTVDRLNQEAKALQAKNPGMTEKQAKEALKPKLVSEITRTHFEEDKRLFDNLIGSKRGFERHGNQIEKIVNNTDFEKGIDADGNYRTKTGGKINVGRLAAIKNTLDGLQKNGNGNTQSTSILDSLNRNNIKIIPLDAKNFRDNPSPIPYRTDSHDKSVWNDLKIKDPKGADISIANDDDIKKLWEIRDDGYHDLNLKNADHANFFNKHVSTVQSGTASRGLDKMTEAIQKKATKSNTNLAKDINAAFKADTSGKFKFKKDQLDKIFTSHTPSSLANDDDKYLYNSLKLMRDANDKLESFDKVAKKVNYAQQRITK